MASNTSSNILSVFRHRNYKLFFFGQLISLLGFWMQAIAQSWLIYNMSNSVFLLGFINFLNLIPVVIVSPFAGVLADRVPRRRILLTTQTIMMVNAGILSALTLSGLVEVWHIAVLAALSGTANAFDVPTRQSFTIEMVGRTDLPQAIALNSIMFNAARLIGPAAAGWFVAVIGEGLCMAVNAVSYLAVLTALVMMKLEPLAVRQESHPWEDLKAGFAYVVAHKEIRTLLAMLASSTLFGGAWVSLMPVFARDILKGGSDDLGVLVACVGAGALLGALSVSRLSPTVLHRVPFLSAICFGVFLIGFSQSTFFLLSAVLIVPAGFGMMSQGIASNTLIQTQVEEAMRGRVMAYYVMAFLGMVPLSALAAGLASDFVGAPWTLTVGGCLVIAASCLSQWREIRRAD